MNFIRTLLAVSALATLSTIAACITSSPCGGPTGTGGFGGSSSVSTSTTLDACGSGGVAASSVSSTAGSTGDAGPCVPCLDVLLGAPEASICPASAAIYGTLTACGCAGACAWDCSDGTPTCHAFDGLINAACKACLVTPVTGCSIEYAACVADDGTVATTSSGSSGAGSASTSASSSSGGPGCPICSAAKAGDFQSDRLCPASSAKFNALYDCACVDPGVCSSLCIIPEVAPGDGATCGLTDPAASIACLDCIADTVTGCGALDAACLADDGTN